MIPKGFQKGIIPSRFKHLNFLYYVESLGSNNLISDTKTINSVTEKEKKS